MKRIWKMAANVLVMALVFSILAGCSNETINEGNGNNMESGDGINREVTLDMLASEQKSDYSIVVAQDATASESFAASEMQTFLEQITGAKIAILRDSETTYDTGKKYLSIGNNRLLEQAGIVFDYSTLNEDGFFIKTKGKSLFINGANDRGVLYGVYDFLEATTGLRFLTKDYTYVPELQILPLYEIDRVQVPAFANRLFLGPEYTDELFALRTRMISEHVHMPEQYGGNIGWYSGFKHQTHNSLEYVPADVYFADYEEMFSVKDGEASEICFSNGITDDGKIDETMEVSAIKIAIESLKKFILDADDTDIYFNFGQMDNGVPCTCKRCMDGVAKYKRSGMLIRFINLMVDEVKKWIDTELPGRQFNIVTFAYQYSEIGPSEFNEATGKYEVLDQTCIPRDNVYIRIAPAHGEYYVSYTDERQPESTKLVFRSWENVHDKFMIWSYHAHFDNNFWYFSTSHSWRDQLMFLKDFGTHYVLMQSGYYDTTQYQQVMDTYVASKMLWNPDQDVNALINEFVTLYYGAAATQVKEFIDIFDAHMYVQFLNGYDTGYSPINRYNASYFPVTFLEEQLARVDNAFKIVKQSGYTEDEQRVYIDRLRQLRLVPAYMYLHNFSLYYPDKIYEEKALAKEFFDECEDLGVRYYRESRLLSVLKAQYGL